jgi:hypothetical protein
MTASREAVASIILAAVGWPLGALGILSQLGDAAPWVTAAELASMRRNSMAAFAIGCCCIAAAFWFAGRSYSAARTPSLVALLLCVVPLLLALGSMFR